MQNSKKNELQKFEFNSHQFRIIVENDKLLFLATDIARLLGYKRPQDLIEKVHISQKLKEEIALSGQNREVWLFTEGGFYAALLKSGKEAALSFQLYVTDTVLPSIRKTGGYNADRVQNPVSVPNQMELNLQPHETIRVIPNELYEELMTIESKVKRMKLMKLYKAIAAKGQTL